MRKVHTFQKYSQRENWVTNNTLLFFSRLQSYDNKKFEKVINAILQENNLNLNIGVNFYQQERAAESIFDGNISQDEFKIAIETKLFDNFSLDQLKRHVSSLSMESGKNRILLALSKSEISKEIKSQVINYLKSTNTKIKFASISFSALIELVSQNIAEFETDFIEVIEEFREFCDENTLTRDEADYMLVVAASTSLRENLDYGVYYDPITRKHNTPFKYMGLYFNKSIVAIGEVVHCIQADFHENNIIIRDNVNVSEDVKRRILEIIRKTNYYDIRTDHKFYVVDRFYETNFVKRSSGSLRGKRYFRISDLPGIRVGMNANEIAVTVNGKEWH